MLVLYLWPKTYHGKRIGLVMTIFIFLLYGASIPFVISNPSPQAAQWTPNPNNTDYNNWTSETRERLLTASISALVLGILAFVFTFLTILFEDKVVASIVSKFPKQSKKKEEA